MILKTKDYLIDKLIRWIIFNPFHVLMIFVGIIATYPSYYATKEVSNIWLSISGFIICTAFIGFVLFFVLGLIIVSTKLFNNYFGEVDVDYINPFTGKCDVETIYQKEYLDEEFALQNRIVQTPSTKKKYTRVQAINIIAKHEKINPTDIELD